MDYSVCVPCLFGLESVVAEELKRLDFRHISSENGRVNFRGGLSSVARANLNLRCGERVLIIVGTCSAENFNDLFEGVKALPWERFIPYDGEFPVKGHLRDSKLRSVPDSQAIIKKAIVERMKKHYGINWFDENGARFRVQFSIVKDVATLYIDTSGASLHKRGYRENSVAAPLRETLAAALIILSRWRGDRLFIDPFCGSGTIPIEAALIASGIAPGLYRRFEAEKWSTLPKETWEEERQLAHLAIKAPEKLVFASDIDPAAVSLAEDNARKAGVSDLITFSRQDALKVDYSEIDRAKGYLITNPPYGERISDQETVNNIYRALAERFAEYPSLKHFILSSHNDFESIFGPADRRRKLYNGMLVCNMYSYFKNPKCENNTCTER